MSAEIKSILEDLSQAELFQKVGDICALVNSAVNEDELLTSSLRQTMELFGAGRGSIFILGDDHQLTLKAAQGMKSDEQAKISFQKS